MAFDYNTANTGSIIRKVNPLHTQSLNLKSGLCNSKSKTVIFIQGIFKLRFPYLTICRVSLSTTISYNPTPYLTNKCYSSSCKVKENAPMRISFFGFVRNFSFNSRETVIVIDSFYCIYFPSRHSVKLKSTDFKRILAREIFSTKNSPFNAKRKSTRPDLD